MQSYSFSMRKERKPPHSIAARDKNNLNQIIMQGYTFDIILVRPAIPENVGSIARAMKTFGFDRLSLANPSFVWDPDGPAWKTACGAREILTSARVFGDLESAVASCHRVIGFSRREHDFDRPRLDLASWVDELRSTPALQNIALVFGPEDFGLSNADKRYCSLLVNIPTHAETLSLNLAQAATIVLYDISRRELCDFVSPPPREEFATQEDIQRMLARLMDMLDETNYFKAGRRERQIETLRNLIFRLHLNAPEYNAMMGVLNALERRRSNDNGA